MKTWIAVHCHQIIWRKSDKCPKESPGMLYVDLRWEGPMRPVTTLSPLLAMEQLYARRGRSIVTAVTKAEGGGQGTTWDNLKYLVSWEERSMTYSRARGSGWSGIINRGWRYCITQLSNYHCPGSGEGIPYKVTDGEESQREIQAHGVETRGRRVKHKSIKTI